MKVLKCVVITITCLIIMCPIAYSNESIIDTMHNRFGKLTTYSATIYTKDKKEVTEIQYYYKKPGFLKMKFISPHNGAELTYSPVTKKAIVKPFKSLSLKVTLSPDNSLIKKNGHTVDQSDLGFLLKKIKDLSKKATISTESTAFFHKLTVVGNNGFKVDGVNSYKVKIDKIVMLPVEIKSYDVKGKLIEAVEMRNLQVDHLDVLNLF